MPHLLIDLTGLSVAAEDLLAAVLATGTQPLWITDPAGAIRFASPAALAALGYETPGELLGRSSHEAAHRGHPGMGCALLEPLTTGERVTGDLDWFLRRDGTTVPVSWVSAPVPTREGRGLVVAFTANEDRVAELTALRRVATLVAQDSSADELFGAVAEETGRLLGGDFSGMIHYAPDGTWSVLATWAAEGEHPPLPASAGWRQAPGRLSAEIARTGRPARIDDWAPISGPVGEYMRDVLGVVSSLAAPILVDGRVWGALVVHYKRRTSPRAGTASRLTDLTELVATAVSNAHARAEMRRLAEEQAALRRVATLVARESRAERVLDAVAGEVGRLLPVEDTAMLRYEDDGTATLVASWGERGGKLGVGSRMPVEGENVTARVKRTGRPARIDDYTEATGAIGTRLRAVGTGSAVGCPIVVDGRLWGVMIAAQGAADLLPPETEQRVAQFTELISTAISNVQARSDLAASRARIVAAADDERRRVVRDLHDGAQQRLVHTVITLKQALRADREDVVREHVRQALEQAERTTSELRELAQGLLPAVLTHGGLRASIDALAARTPVPVDVAVGPERFSPPIEATAYFVVAESLTNVAKHSRARAASVTARVADRVLRVEVRDDGVGGARPSGLGLVGLADRLAVLEGSLRIESPGGGGTLVAAEIPLGS